MTKNKNNVKQSTKTSFLTKISDFERHSGVCVISERFLKKFKEDIRSKEVRGLRGALLPRKMSILHDKAENAYTGIVQAAKMRLGRGSIVQGVAVKQRTGKELLKAHVKAFADRVQGLQLHRSASLLLDRGERRLRYAAPSGQFVFCHVSLDAQLLDAQCYRVL